MATLSGSALRGTVVSLGFSSTTVDLEVTDVTVVCDGPAVNGVVPRVQYDWRPGGAPGDTDDQLTWDDTNSRIVFTLTSTDTAGMALGHWDIYMLAGDPPTTQDDALTYDLNLYDARGGAMPVV